MLEAAFEAEKSGVDYFQLREKDLPDGQLLDMAKEIRAVLQRTHFIVNGSLAIALSSHADGVHLQKDNLSIEVVRSRFGGLKIGYSAHSLEDMLDAQAQGADYVFISPVFEPASKASALPPIGSSALAEWVDQIKIPVFALGGISVQNLQSVQDAGCDGAAGISLFVKEGKFAFPGMEF